MGIFYPALLNIDIMNLEKFFLPKFIHFYIIIGIVCLYIQTLSFDYIWDDLFLIQDNYKIKTGDISGILVPILPGTTYFRPLVMFSFLLDNFFSNNPWFSHFVNILFFYFNAVLIYFISLRIFNKLKLNNIFFRSSLVAILYIIHPVMVETTAWISGRFDIFVTFFLLLSIYVYIISNVNFKRDIVISCLYLMGLLSKELAIIFPALLLFLYILLNSEQQKSIFSIINDFIIENKRLYLFILILFICYSFLKKFFVGGVYHGGYEVYSLIQNIKFWWILLPSDTFCFYLERIFLPYKLMAPFHLGDSETLKLPSIYIKVLVFIIFLYLIAYGTLKKKKIALFMLMAFISIFLVLNIIPITIGGNIGHDRFLTFPLVFVLMGLMSLEFSVGESFKKIMIIIGMVYCAILITVSYTYTSKWKNEVTLWGYTYNLYSGNSITSIKYIRALVVDNQIEKLSLIFDKALIGTRKWNFIDAINLSEYLIGRKDEEANLILNNLLSVALKTNKSTRNSVENRSLFEIYFDLSRASVIFNKNYNKALYYINEAEKFNANSINQKVVKEIIIIEVYHKKDYQKLDQLVDLMSDNDKKRFIKANIEMVDNLCNTNQLNNLCISK